MSQTKKMQERNAKIDALFKHSSSAIVMLDPKYRIMDINQEFENIFGYQISEIKGRNLDDLFDQSQANSADREATKEILAGNKVESKGIRCSKSGKMIKFIYKGIPIIVDDQVVGAYGIYTDITELEKSRENLLKTRNQLQSILSAIKDGIMLLDPNLEIIYANDTIKKWYPDKSEFENSICYQKFHDRDRPCNSCPTLRTMKTKNVEKEIVSEARDNKINFTEVFSYPIINKQGEIDGVVEFARDITEQRELEKRLQIREEQYRKIFAEAPVGIMLENKHGKILKVNQKLCEITGYQKEELEGSSIFKTLVPTKAQKKAENNIQRVLKGEELDFEADSRKKSGERYLAHIKETSILLPEQGKGILSMQTDITDIKEKEDKLKYLSYHDKLTGLYNRSFFEEELQRLNVERQFPLTLIMVDVNGLKLINDTYGHEFGDQILIKAAEILSKELRQEDIVVRLGGDEFAMILPQTKKEEAEKIIQRIKTKCSETETDQISVSLGIGYAVKREVGENIREIFNKADDRMYKDKLTNGRSEKNKLVRNLLETLGAKSNETREHAVRMTDYAFKLGEKVKLSNEQLNDLMLLATLHDIGKVTISEDILKKPGKLNELEWEIMKEHPEKGYSIAAATNEFAAVAKFILHHHEYWDGSGYPEGLAGEKIPLLSRIITIVDSFDVMTHDRPYSKAMTVEEAVEELKLCSGNQFDPNLIEEFIKII